MLQDGDGISVRAVVRRMHTIGQPSTVTRDVWRMAQITAHQIAQEHSRHLSAPVPQNEKANIPEGGPIAQWAEFRELRCFLAAARTGNLGQVARELTLSQPGVTRQIRKIEDRLGTQLFVRHGRGVTLTSAGLRLFDRLEPIMRLLSLPLERDPEPTANLGILSIALPPEVGSLIGPAFVERAQVIWPNIKIEIHSGISSSLLEWILNGRVEIGVLQDPPAHDSFHAQPVLRTNLGLVIGPSSTLSDCADPLRFRELASLPLILTSPRHCYRRVVVRAGSKHGVDLIPKIEIDNIPIIKAMVNEGIGYAILPAMAVQDEIARGALLYRRIEQPSLSTTLAIVFHRATTSILTECADMLRAQMTAPRTRAKWPDSELI
jgi:LysR family transcriptional regulator, nitrogen assimilation regulatory protein